MIINISSIYFRLVIDKLGGRDTLIEDLKTENQSKKR